MTYANNGSVPLYLAEQFPHWSPAERERYFNSLHKMIEVFTAEGPAALQAWLVQRGGRTELAESITSTVAEVMARQGNKQHVGG
ncbi:hypothetical protein ACIRPT_21570 [Streptomyces sp. NPDC101227]|uniref:hypothetical protein n=1 Tax=Streptomyces sp. NPDC101227 TaxID=3366136 RepID=UPI0037FC2B54